MQSADTSISTLCVPPRPDHPADNVRTRRERADFFEHGPIRSHWAGPDGGILTTHRAELDLLGYSRQKSVGRETTGFHQKSVGAGRGAIFTVKIPRASGTMQESV